jgi:thiol:disulfide interchange protein DsbD
LGFLGCAFIGGLILNLMPCVLPVLSLKVFSLMKHAGENPKAAWIQGVAVTAGVVLSFWVLAGLLLALRAAGNQLGWGFQMQSPGFVLALIFLFFLLALNLFGVFELGSSLVGLDAKATGHLGGLASSFGNGALATLAATPCTAPFMGSSLGFAAQQPAPVALLIFTFLALGMATPYLLLTIFPGALRFVPKPGAWMEAFKQFMGFLLMATVIFLVYVFGALVGNEQVPWLLFDLLLVALAAWIYGSWATPARRPMVRFVAVIMALGWLGYAIYWGVLLAKAAPEDTAAQRTAAATAEGWQPWSQDAVDQALAQGRPVFVDFTAAWCLSCKVNEAVALETDAVKQAFAQKNVALFRADWTHSDPEISKALRQYNRDGVPLYLLYAPKNKDAPQVLPEVLTPGIVLDALNNKTSPRWTSAELISLVALALIMAVVAGCCIHYRFSTRGLS